MDTILYQTSALREIEARHRDEPLMLRAGAAAAAWAAELAGQRGEPVLVLAGPGNNGGDAFEVARLLRERYFDVHVAFAGDGLSLPGDAMAAWERFRAAGVAAAERIPDRPRWGLIVDGLFGIGLARPPEGIFAEWINSANRLAERDGCPLLALDCPSGLNADSGRSFKPCVVASHTITFISGKPGLWTGDGPDRCGQIRVARLDLDAEGEIPAKGRLVDRSLFGPLLRPRARNTHKGSFGSAGIVGGGKSMLGAALLAARAALKLGTGRVYLGLHDPDAPAVDPVFPELMLRRADALLQAELNALACGPGLGRSSEAVRLVEQALKCPLPVVLDADALNILASDGRLEGNLYNRVAPAILTPHPVEAGRLLGISAREVQDDRVAAANELASRYRCCIALKGCGTVVAAVDGSWWINSTGNPGMATAGMGDILSGIIVALLAQGWPAEQAVIAGVHLHGAAADRLVAEGIGPIGLTAGEVIDAARREFNVWMAPARPS